MKLYKEDGESIPAIKVLPDGDPTPSGYTEITDIVEAYNYGSAAIDKNTPGWVDRLCFRTKLKAMIYTKMQASAEPTQAEWDTLTADEKRIAADLFVIGTESYFLEVENDLRCWTVKAGDYRLWTMAVREERADLAEAVLFMRMLNLGDAKQALADLTQITKDTILDIDEGTKKLKSKARVKKLNRQYIEGLEDEEHDGVVAVKDWSQSTVDTPYENGGFMNLGYPFKGTHTSASVRDELLAALDGTY